MMFFLSPALAGGGHGDDHGAAGTAHEGAAHGEGHGADHHGPDWQLVGFQAINFVLLLVILFFAARRPVSDALGNRANAVRRDLDESAQKKDAAEARYHEIEQKLATLDKRIEELKAEAAREADAEARRIGERADADAIRLQETAERTIREEGTRARNEIRKEVVEQASRLAKELVAQSVTPGDQAALHGQFLGALQKPAGGQA